MLFRSLSPLSLGVLLHSCFSKYAIMKLAITKMILWEIPAIPAVTKYVRRIVYDRLRRWSQKCELARFCVCTENAEKKTWNEIILGIEQLNVGCYEEAEHLCLLLFVIKNKWIDINLCAAKQSAKCDHTAPIAIARSIAILCVSELASTAFIWINSFWCVADCKFIAALKTFDSTINRNLIYSA